MAGVCVKPGLSTSRHVAGVLGHGAVFDAAARSVEQLFSRFRWQRRPDFRLPESFAGDSRPNGQQELCMWYQHEISLPEFTRGCHLITDYVRRGCPEIGDLSVGLLHVFICHTSASLTINENADPDVLVDLSMAFERISPENWPWTHTCEGPDDMPAHVKSSLTDSSVSVPIRDGRLLTGTWQGIYLCEHRNRGGSRRLVLTVQGQRRDAGEA